MRPFHASILVSSLVAAPAAAAFADETPRQVTDRLVGPWQLFVDDGVVAARTNVVRRYHSFRRQGNKPLIVVDRPWEAHVVNCTAIIPAEDGAGFRMYYYCWSENPSGKGRRSFMCYAESRDGIQWDKPALGQYEWEGSKDTNILDPGPTFVFRTPWEQDPQKRFQGVGGMYHAFSSPDGLHWKQESTEPIVSGGDTSHFYWDPNTGLFRATVKGGAGAGVSDHVSGLRRRTVGFAETADLRKFPPLRMIMAPDEIDDLWCRPDTVQRTHFYACPVVPYETMYIGLLQIYRAEEPEGYFHGPLWLELVSSRDGIHWNRVEPDPSIKGPYETWTTTRPPLLPLGKYREFDRGMVIAPPPLRVGDELWLYYTGYDEMHDWLPYKSAIGLAKMRKDGWASLDADESPGEIVTRRLENAGGGLQVNYEARGGSIRVEVLDAAGQVMPGYGRDDCEPLTGDAIRGRVVWRTRDALPADTTIRLRFLLDRARIYSFMAGENVRILAEEPGPVLQALFTFEGRNDPWADRLPGDGLQLMRNLGTCAIDHKNPDPAFGKRSLIVESDFRPWNRVEILGTQDLGRRFTLAAMVKCRSGLSRLFSAYEGNHPIRTGELVFDFDSAGRMVSGLRLICKGLVVQSDPVTFDDGGYHHLAVTCDDGCVTFYLDGRPVGQRWIPGGDPVRLARNLLVGEDAHRGSDESLRGRVDDVLVLGRVLSEPEIQALSRQGAAVLFELGE